MGIGASNPEQKLHIRGDDNEYAVLEFEGRRSTGTSKDRKAFIGVGATGGNWGTDMYFRIRNSSAETVTWDTNSSNVLYMNGSTTYLYTGNTERMTINSDGNVGIGTTSPGSMLHVMGSIRGARNDNIASYFGRAAVGYCGHDDCMSVAHLDRNTTTSYALLQNVYGDTLLNAANGRTLYFRINNVNQITITSGNVTASGSVSAASVTSSGRISGSAGMNITGNWDTIDYGGLESDYLTLGNQVQGDPPSYGFSIHAANAIEAEALVVTSDRRIKDNIEEINDDIALQQLRQLRPSTYTYKDTYRRGSEPVIGFIAQEVREVLPYAVMNKTSAIPNILKPGIAHIMENNITELRLGIPLDDDMQLTNTSLIKLNVDNRSIEVEVVSCPNKNVIEIVTHEGITDEAVIIVYGEIVEDFHCLNKESIFTVATAALQEVDRQLQAEKAEVATLKTQLTDVLTRLSALENN